MTENFTPGPVSFTKYESPAVGGDGYNLTATVLSLNIGEITVPIRAFGSNDTVEYWGAYKEWEELIRKLAAAPKMYAVLQKIAEKEPAEYYECGGACNNCYEMIELAREALGLIEKEAQGEK